MNESYDDLAVSLVTSLAGCLYRIDYESGKILLLSGEVAAITGYTPSHFKDVSDVFALSADSPQVLSERHQLGLGTTDIWDLDYEIKHKDGHKLWVNSRGRYVRNSEGEISHVDGLFVDITERKRDENVQEVQSAILLEIGSEALVFDVHTLRLIYANEAILDNLQYSLKALRFLSLKDYLAKADLDKFLGYLEQVKNGSGPLNFDISMCRKNGEHYVLQAALKVSKRDSSLLVLYGQDSTAHRLREKASTVIREQYQRAIDASATTAWEWDIENNQFTATAAIYERLGWSHFRLDASPLTQMLSTVHEDDRRNVEATINAALHTESEFVIEYRMMERSGGILWVISKGRAQFNDAGKAIHLSGTVSDITERKLAQIETHDSITKLEAVLDNIADGIITLSNDGLVQSINTAAANLLGQYAHEIIGHSIHQQIKVAGTNLSSWGAVADRAIRECEVDTFDFEIIPAEIAVSETKLATGRIFIVVIRDISKRKRVEQEILEAKERAEHAAKSKSEFLATMSHEIRTPMNGILGMTQLLLDTTLSKEQAETAKIIYSSGDALLTIINDILDYSKIESGKLELESEFFDLRVSIVEVLEIVQSTTIEKNCPLVINYPLDLAHRFHGDAGKIRQVLLNLLGNAAKFSTTGSIKIDVSNYDQNRILIKVIDSGIGIPEHVLPKLFESFSQADVSTTRVYGGTGLGLAICKKLVALMGGDIGVSSVEGEGATFWFTVNLSLDRVPVDPVWDTRFNDVTASICLKDFYYAQDLSTQMSRFNIDASAMPDLNTLIASLVPGKQRLLILGDELDLTLAKKLLHKITLPEFDVQVLILTSMWSKRRQLLVETGFKFFISSPVSDRNLLAQVNNILSATPQADDDHELPKLVQFKGDNLRILLAEDNVVNQKVVVRMLTKMGCRVDVAANGIEAYDMWLKFPYHLVLMDCRMPELDGLKATLKIREEEKNRSLDPTPIIAMTANVMAEDRAACFEAGMDDYTAKPVHREALKNLLVRWTDLAINK